MEDSSHRISSYLLVVAYIPIQIRKGNKKWGSSVIRYSERGTLFLRLVTDWLILYQFAVTLTEEYASKKKEGFRPSPYKILHGK
jgi:hypothetical protein